jgi:hypothetical protein
MTVDPLGRLSPILSLGKSPMKARGPVDLPQPKSHYLGKQWPNKRENWPVGKQRVDLAPTAQRAPDGYDRYTTNSHMISHQTGFG